MHSQELDRVISAQVKSTTESMLANLERSTGIDKEKIRHSVALAYVEQGIKLGILQTMQQSIRAKKLEIGVVTENLRNFRSIGFSIKNPHLAV